MSLLPPRPPNENERISRREMFKRGFCTLFHQNEWKSYIVGIDPNVTVAVCSKCGANHLISKGFITREETDRRIDKIVNTRLR